MKKFLIILLFISLVIPFWEIFAYNENTHVFLTDEIISFYNKNFLDYEISNDLKPYLLDGSRHEDDYPRWMNHFYDPVYNRGLTIDLRTFSPKDVAAVSVINTATLNSNWLPSKEWAQDSKNQNSLTYKVPTSIASILTAVQQRKISAISTQTNFTWQKAINYWLSGEKEKAMFTLGHILHLIEDASVPDHTRNDPHPGDSPYENWTVQFTLNTPDNNLSSRLINKNPIILDNLNSYFDKLAKYSNNNFYSKNTIGTQSGYELPNSIERYFENGSWFRIQNDSEEKFKLVQEINPGKFNYAASTQNNFSLIDPNNIVLNDYWSRLSVKAVQYSAGVIDLFFKEVEKARNNPDFVKDEQKGFVAQAVETVGNIASAVGSAAGSVANTVGNAVGSAANAVGDFVAGTAQKTADLVGLNKNENKDFKLAAEIPLKENQSGQPTEIKENNGNIKNTEEAGNVVKEAENAVKNEEININNEKGIVNQNKVDNQDEDVAEMTNKKKQENSNNQSAAGGAAAASQTAISQTAANQTIQPQVCAFNTNKTATRQKLLINEIAWMGGPKSANDEWFELKNISGGDLDIYGWQVFDKDENIKITFPANTKIKAGDFLLFERTDDNSMPGIKADFIYTGALSNSDEGLRIFDKNCDLIDEVLASPSWPAGYSDIRKTMERTNDLSWHTYSQAGEYFGGVQIMGTPKKENSPAVITPVSSGGGGGSGNATNSNNNQQEIVNNKQSPAKIIISEIMYDLDGADDGREWIEIFNSGSEAVDLTSWKFYENQTNHNLTLVSGVATLSAGAYAIIADDATKFLNDNSQFNGALFDSSFSLSNTGESITIKNGDNVIDGVIYSSEWGAKGDGKSLQKINGQWQAAIPTPGAENKIAVQSNQAPGAFFDYAPQNPKIGEIINFNAASSTSSNGNIISYNWDFGDNATTSIAVATTTHSYLLPGNYLIQLSILDNQNAVSTATSTISVSPAPPAAVQNFNATYNQETRNVLLNWSESRDYSGASSTIKYLLKYATSSPGMIDLITLAATTTYSFKAEKLGINYVFSVAAKDINGLMSKSATTTLNIPAAFTETTDIGDRLVVQYGNLPPENFSTSTSVLAPISLVRKIETPVDSFIKSIGLVLKYPFGWYNGNQNSRLTIKKDNNGQPGDIIASAEISLDINGTNTPPPKLYDYNFTNYPLLKANTFYWLEFQTLDVSDVSVYGNDKGIYTKIIGYQGDLTLASPLQDSVTSVPTITLSGELKSVANSSIYFSYGASKLRSGENILANANSGPAEDYQVWSQNISLPLGSWAIRAQLKNENNALLAEQFLYIGIKGVSESEPPTILSGEKIVLVSQSDSSTIACGGSPTSSANWCGQQIFPLQSGFLESVKLKISYPSGGYGMGDYSSQLVLKEDNGGQPGEDIAISNIFSMYVNSSNPPLAREATYIFSTSTPILLEAKKFYWVFFKDLGGGEGNYVTDMVPGLAIWGNSLDESITGSLWYKIIVHEKGDWFMEVSGDKGTKE